MNLREFAAKELELSGVDEDIYGDMTSKAVLELIDTLSNQGHSGASQWLVMSLMSRLTQWKPLTPLTGEEDEWFDHGDGVYQNKRCPSIFKNAEHAWNVETDENVTFPHVVE